MNHHFFGSTAFGWATADTREEVLQKLARQAGDKIIKRNLKSQGGLYIWTCRVEVPESMQYDINNFMPQGVTITNVQEFNCMNAKGHSLPITRN